MTESVTVATIECLVRTLDVVDQTVEEQQQRQQEHHHTDGTASVELNLLRELNGGEEQQVVKMTQNKVSWWIISRSIIEIIIQHPITGSEKR